MAEETIEEEQKKDKAEAEKTAGEAVSLPKTQAEEKEAAGEKEKDEKISAKEEKKEL